MIAGPFSVCRYDLLDGNSDALVYYTLRHGYDSVADARKAIPDLAKEHGLSEDEICVVRAYAEADGE